MASLPGLATSEGGVMVRKLMMISAANIPSTSRLITKRAATCEVRKEISKGVTRAVYTSAREVRRSQRLRKADVRGSSRMDGSCDTRSDRLLIKSRTMPCENGDQLSRSAPLPLRNRHGKEMRRSITQFALIIATYSSLVCVT